MSMACSRYAIVEFSSVQATTYMIWVLRSMTGVLKMPRWPGGLLGGIAKSAHIGAVVANKLARFTDHKGAPPASASKAYSVSFMVATYRTLCEPKFGMATLGT